MNCYTMIQNNGIIRKEVMKEFESLKRSQYEQRRSETKQQGSREH